MTVFNEVKKKLGFGCMRLPMNGDRVDYAHFSRMVDAFLEAGFNYFDTAHGYLNGASEVALRECLVNRHPRESYLLVDKLTENCFESEEDIRPFFEKQLAICGVEYFDFYLMHAQNRNNYKKYRRCNAYETAFKLKAEGKIKHVGISFHDSAEFLDEILTAYPEIEAVQLQLNYVDMDTDNIQSRKCYEVCVRHDKPVMVMEPVKGGKLVFLPDEAKAVFDGLNGGSPASYAIRFAASFKNVFMVLSGMSNIEQMQDNIGYMTDFKPLDEVEQRAVERVCEIFKSQDQIACTACDYCVKGCPKGILIPRLFAVMNTAKRFNGLKDTWLYSIYTKNAKASDCIGCGKCERVCPQHLPIRKLLQEVSQTFEN